MCMSVHGGWIHWMLLMGNFLKTNKQKTKKMVLISQQTGRKPLLLMVTVLMLWIIPTRISGFQTSKGPQRSSSCGRQFVVFVDLSVYVVQRKKLWFKHVQEQQHSLMLLCKSHGWVSDVLQPVRGQDGPWWTYLCWHGRKLSQQVLLYVPHLHWSQSLRPSS